MFGDKTATKRFFNVLSEKNVSYKSFKELFDQGEITKIKFFNSTVKSFKKSIEEIENKPFYVRELKYYENKQSIRNKRGNESKTDNRKIITDLTKIMTRINKETAPRVGVFAGQLWCELFA